MSGFRPELEEAEDTLVSEKSPLVEALQNASKPVEVVAAKLDPLPPEPLLVGAKELRDEFLTKAAGIPHKKYLYIINRQHEISYQLDKWIHGQFKLFGREAGENLYLEFMVGLNLKVTQSIKMDRKTNEPKTIKYTLGNKSIRIASGATWSMFLREMTIAIESYCASRNGTLAIQQKTTGNPKPRSPRAFVPSDPHRVPKTLRIPDPITVRTNMAELIRQTAGEVFLEEE